MTHRAPLAVRRFTLVAVLIPAVLTTLAVAIQLIALPHVPDPMAIHWGTGGEPDGFGPPWGSVVLTAVVGLGIPLLIALSALAGLRRGDRGTTYRLLGATALATSTLMGVLGTWTFVAQVGLASGQDASAVTVPLIAAFAAAAVAGVLGWIVQPDEPYRPTLLPEQSAIELLECFDDAQAVPGEQGVEVTRDGRCAERLGEFVGEEVLTLTLES